MIGSAKLAHRKSRWKLRRIIALLKSTREGTEGNSCCWKNWGHGHPAIRRLLHMKVIAYRKLPTVEFCISDSCENGITREKCLRNAQANHLFQSIPGSKAMLCNFQCVECLDKYVEQDDGRKGRIPRKDSKRMSMHGGSFRGFGSFCPSVYKGGQPDSEKSSFKLRQVRKWKAEIPDTPPGLTGIGTHTSKKTIFLRAFYSGYCLKSLHGLLNTLPFEFLVFNIRLKLECHSHMDSKKQKNGCLA